MKENIILTAEQQTLVEEHMQIVHWVIHRHIDVNESVCGMGYDDLYQEGCVALCHAAMSYDAQAGRGLTHTLVRLSAIISWITVARFRQNAGKPPWFPLMNAGRMVLQRIA